MLQFGGVMCNVVARFTPRTVWRINPQQLINASSSTAINPNIEPIPSKSEPVSQKIDKRNNQTKENSRSSLVQAAFAALVDKDVVVNASSSSDKNAEVPNSSTTISKAIAEAPTVEKLLTIAMNDNITRKNALQIMSTLSKWINKKKVSLNDFDNDPRFLCLCEQLAGKANAQAKYVDSRHSDLSTIIGLTGDDAAAKLISTLSLHQMIKVMSVLAHKGRRPMTILRSLSFNIGRNTENLNIKQCADLLYAMAVLNFPDEVLLERVSVELFRTIPKNEGNAVVGSIITSIGFLRYRNTELLDLLCDWIVSEPRTFRPQYITSLLLTLATVGYTPTNAALLNTSLVQPLKETDLPASEVWLDNVWATTILGMADQIQISTVLDSVFVQKLIDSQCLTTQRKVKLLNINAAAKFLIPNYEGPFLSEDLDFSNSTLEKSKEKQAYISSVLDTLSNLFTHTTCLKSHVPTGMGFVLDAECYMDDKCNPVPIENMGKKKENINRIATIALCYSDYCRVQTQPMGIYSLITKLLEAQNYKIVMVPYTEYNTKDNLMARVKYLEQKIKSSIKNST